MSEHVEAPKGDRILPECATNSYLYRMVDIYWTAKETLQNIDAICYIEKTKNSNCRT